MKLSRRTFLYLSAGTAALSALPHRVMAQAYPARPVRIIVGFSAGGTTDIAARVIAGPQEPEFGGWLGYCD